MGDESGEELGRAWFDLVDVFVVEMRLQSGVPFVDACLNVLFETLECVAVVVVHHVGEE